jgi:flagellar hook-length control protein FliK
MQFFPAALSHGAQFSRPGGLFEMTDARPGQDFGELFAAHLNERQMPDAPPRAEQSMPHSRQDGAYTDEATPASGRSEGAPPTPPAQDAQSPSARTDVAGRKEENTGSGSHNAAKDAGQREDTPRSEQGESARKTASEERSVSEVNETAQTAVASDDSVLAEVREFLDALAADAGQHKSGPDVAAVSSRIEALHELLRQFRTAPPASRSELAVALGDQLRALQRELATGAKAEGSGDSRGKAGVGSRAASPVEQNIHALLQRLEARTATEHETAIAPQGRGPAVSSVVAGSAEAKNDQAGRSRQARASVTTKTAAQDAVVDVSARRHGDGIEAGAPGVLRDGKGQEASARPVSRQQQNPDAPQGRSEIRGAGLENLSQKSTQIPAGTEEQALSSADQFRKSAAADADRVQVAVKGQDGSTRSETAVTHSGIAAAASRPAVAKDGSAQAMPQADPLRQDGPMGASEKARNADSGGPKNQPDARQGFFGESGRDKTASRATQASGSGKNVPESMTQASAQNAQTQFQQRLESPVSARSANVYQQVENGAFKNLGQGVKQLVIRLDPADLGQVSVILQVRGKEVQAVLRASNQDTSLVLNEQLGQLRSQLEAQGLKVGKLEVQTQLADSQSQSQWQGAESHNRYQENQELAMSAKRWRTLERAAPGLVRDVQNSPHRENLSQSGLDIFA